MRKLEQNNMNLAHTFLAPVAQRVRKTLTSTLCLASGVALFLTTAFSPMIAINASAQKKSLSRNYLKVTAADSGLTKEIRLGLDKSIVIDLPADAHDILVANPEVADAVTRTSRRIYVFGKKIGQTNIFIFDGRGNQVASLELIVERDIAGLEDTIRRLIPNSEVRAEMINDNIVLTGSVTTPQDAATAARLANIFVTGGENTASDGEGSNGQLSLFGSADKPTSQIVNMLQIEGEDQVLLKVVVAEIQRDVVKLLGLNTSLGNSTNDGIGFEVFGGRTPTLDQFTGGSGGRFATGGSLFDLSGTFLAMERNGVMRTLAEPSLTAISGEKAHFQVGGTYHIPESITNGDNGSASVKYKEVEYGISLTFTPVVLTAGRISLKIRTEVSEPTMRGVKSLRTDVNLLSIRKRLADTTVELPSGGSMIIAGLVQDDVRQAINGQPGLMDIPFFGALFRSREFIRNETEVVILVTPYLVRPTARKNLAQPDQNFHPASDPAGYFMGRVNRVYGTKQGNLPKGRYTGSIGFILK